MDKDAIDGALHEISMMVSVILGSVETMQAAADTVPRVWQIPDEAGELLSFGAFDIDKRVKALREAICA
jgi:hypothetical protein